MKKASCTLSILCALNVFAFAGPEQYSGKEMKQVAPMPPACPSWTGFYVGGFAGYKFAATDLDLDLDGLWNGPNPGDPVERDTIVSHSQDDLDTSGFEAGGLVGYNYQWNKWVFGLEASGGYVWLDNANITAPFGIPVTPATPNDTNVYDIRASFKTNYLVTVGPRIGYAFCKWLPYVTGGLAVGDIDFHQLINLRNNFFFQEGGSTSETKVGWMVGGGLQYSITDHWSARAQYQYIDLGCVDFNHAGTAPFQGFTGNSEACLREHNASFAIIYGF